MTKDLDQVDLKRGKLFWMIALQERIHQGWVKQDSRGGWHLAMTQVRLD